MNKDALERAAKAVYAEFAPAEAAADAAAARTARLLATVLEQRAAAKISIGSGALLVRKLAKSFAAQIDAREDFIMAHKLAARLPIELGIAPLAYGDTEECPPASAGLEDGNVVRLAVA